MVITPNSKIKLIKNPLKLDSNNEITFSNAQSQYNYFNSLPKLEFDNLTYVRKDGVLRIETDDNLTFEDLLEYNFCMYQNTHFDNKWFYAFITDVTWINPGLTELKLETAYFQTWQFDLIYMDSFIEREHVNDDTIGLHTIPEGLETGEYITNNIIKNNSLNASKVIIGVTVDYYIDSTTGNFVLGGNTGGGTYGGIKSAYAYRYFNPNSQKLLTVIEGYANNGQSDAIGQLFIAPTFLVPKDDETITDDGNVKETLSPVSYSWDNYGDSNIIKPSSINGYTPKNNKLFTYPYQYLLMTNNNGGNAIYHYELFKNPTGSPQDVCNFTIQGIVTPSMSGLIVPVHYNGSDGNNYSESLSLPKFPICGWDTDIYTNWLTQNGVNIGVQLFSSAMQILGGANLMSSRAGNLQGSNTILSGSTQIANILGQVREHQMISPQAQGNTNTGDISYSTGNTTITAYQMSIKQEYAKIIDDYFTMFGYKVNRLGTPHINIRPYYDYIKTIDVNIEGNIPESDLNQIRNMFNNGIRFWHNTNYYLDFSVNNNI